MPDPAVSSPHPAQFIGTGRTGHCAILYPSCKPAARHTTPQRCAHNLRDARAAVSSQQHEPAPRQGPASGESLLAWSVPSHRPWRSTREPEATVSRSPPLRMFQTTSTRRSARQRDQPHTGNHSLGNFKPVSRPLSPHVCCRHALSSDYQRFQARLLLLQAGGYQSRNGREIVSNQPSAHSRREFAEELEVDGLLGFKPAARSFSLQPVPSHLAPPGNCCFKPTAWPLSPQHSKQGVDF